MGIMLIFGRILGFDGMSSTTVFTLYSYVSIACKFGVLKTLCKHQPSNFNNTNIRCKLQWLSDFPCCLLGIAEGMKLVNRDVPSTTGLHSLCF